MTYPSSSSSLLPSPLIRLFVSVFSSADSSCSADNSPDDSIASHSLRNDLLVAADSVTNAMSSLVRELNSGLLNFYLNVSFGFVV